MRMVLSLTAALILTATTTWSAEPAPPSFTKKPIASRDGGNVTIDFAVDRETDVAVYVENAKGEIVLHLVAGVLGKNPPEPLKAGSLEQSVVWDGKDDLGKDAAAGGALRVRVALGLKPALERFIGFDPADLGNVRGLATGPGGEVFVFHVYGSAHPEDASTACAVFSREGKYLRTIVPYPASLPDEKLAGLKRLRLDDGSKVPFIYHIETRATIPGLGIISRQRPVVTRDGRLAFAGIREMLEFYSRTGESRLTVIHTDGSVPKNGVLKTLIAPLAAAAPSLALSPDEKTLYAAGLETARKPGVRGSGYLEEVRQATHAVYRFGWDDLEAKVFVGDERRPGNKENELHGPQGVATDQDGNVYVADRNNDRIAVFKPDGTPLTRIPIARPCRVEVHRRTGEIYVLSGEKAVQLVKLDGYKTGKEVCRLALPSTGLMALDDWVDPPMVWLNVQTRASYFNLQRVQDKGRSFGDPLDLGVTLAELRQPRSMGAGTEISLDRVNGWLYVNNYWRCRVADGTWELLPRPNGWGHAWPNNTPDSTTGYAGLDGNYYMNFGAHGARIERYGPDLKALPFVKPDRSDLAGKFRYPGDVPEVPGRIVGFARTHGQGQTADPFGTVYVLWKKAPADPGDYHRATALYVYDSEGRRQVDKDKLVDASIPGLFSIRVDYAGNLYVAAGLRKGQGWVPEDLKDQIPATVADGVSDGGANGYPLIYGSIVKFGRKGGQIRDQIGGVPCNYAHGRPIEVKGADWICSQASTVSSWATPKSDPNAFNLCLCEAACFDVDGFGRSFFPDAGRCRVGVVDTRGNLICWLGAYGNPDSAGPGSTIPKPDIPFAWPQAVAVGDRSAYVSDRLNRRIVAVRLHYAAEQTVDVH